ncbi:MAG: tryptophanase [Acidobacteriota bacterium]|nr:tryptophanase [Acidobacteriota bacterium]MDW3229175.1 tryptophanase [Acidobacteriota bacterium]
MSNLKAPVEPFRIKTVERIKMTGRRERENILQKAGYNVFNIPAEKVFIDLLTDSGTAAMSDNQWAGLMTGDESYAGAKNFFHLEATVKNIFCFKHVIPTHQGRAAERILFEGLVKKGDFVPNNIHFDTTRANVEVRGARAVDLVIDEAYDPDTIHPFKGNLDVDKLKKFIEKKGPKKIPLVMMTITNNSGGGQPVSVKNVKEVNQVCQQHKIPLFFDACRFAENAYFIKKREKGFEKKSVLEIAQEIFSYGQGATMSAKKDALVNIGGFITLDDDQLAEKLKSQLVLSEGFTTYGGLAGRDLEAIARGLEEVLEEDYLEYRINQVAYLGQLLDEAGVPILRPVGGHAVYLLADRFLPHIPRHQFPGWALTVALYREAGIRAVEIGGVMFAHKDEKTGQEIFPALELVRLAIPRRVYTSAHLEYVAEALANLYKNRERVRGLRIVRESQYLRHFTIRMEEL